MLRRVWWKASYCWREARRSFQAESDQSLSHGWGSRGRSEAASPAWKAASGGGDEGGGGVGADWNHGEEGGGFGAAAGDGGDADDRHVA